MPFFPLNPSQAADNTCWAAGLLMGLFLVISPSKPFADAEETFFFSSLWSHLSKSNLKVPIFEFLQTLRGSSCQSFHEGSAGRLSLSLDRYPLKLQLHSPVKDFTLCACGLPCLWTTSFNASQGIPLLQIKHFSLQLFLVRKRWWILISF